MPWTPREAQKHTHKAKSAKSQRMWSDVANSVLNRTGDEAAAVREANGVIAKHEFTADQERRQRRSRAAANRRGRS